MPVKQGAKLSEQPFCECQNDELAVKPDNYRACGLNGLHWARFLP